MLSPRCCGHLFCPFSRQRSGCVFSLARTHPLCVQAVVVHCGFAVWKSGKWAGLSETTSSYTWSPGPDISKQDSPCPRPPFILSYRRLPSLVAGMNLITKVKEESSQSGLFIVQILLHLRRYSFNLKPMLRANCVFGERGQRLSRIKFHFFSLQREACWK